MPRRLIDRCQPDSILEFRASARQRFSDALSLATAGHRTGAIYLWGYCAEMILKSAYFSLMGLPDHQTITVRGDIWPAITRGRSVYHIAWPPDGAGHNVRAWAELLVAERASSSATAYLSSFGLQVQGSGQRIGYHWKETLRYHKNLAYTHEMRKVRESVEWLMVNESSL